MRKLFLIALAMLLASCDSASIDSSGKSADIRFINASPDSNSVDLLIDGLQVFSDVRYGESSGYFDIDDDERRLRVLETSTQESLIDILTTLRRNKEYSFLAVNKKSSIQPLLIEDNNEEPDFDEFRLRIIHAGPELGTVNVYVTDLNDDLDDNSPTVSTLGFKGVSQYLGYDASDGYRVRVTAPGSFVPLIDTGSLRFRSGEVKTLVLLDAPGGGAPYRSLLILDKDFD